MTKRPTPPTDDEIAVEMENRALTMFWHAVRFDENRLALLLDFTRLTIIRSVTWDPEAIRAEHTARLREQNVTLDHERCFACRTADDVMYAHHVIEIQHGGSNNLRNRVPLCFDCHQYLHPWLTEQDRQPGKKSKGFESLGEIAARTLRPPQ